MFEPSLSRAGGVVGHWLRGLTLLGLMLLLVACAGGSTLGDNITAPNPKGKTPPPVQLAQLTGMPPDKARDFKQALAISAGQHDVGIVEGNFQTGSFSLTLKFRAASVGGQVHVSNMLELRDEQGVLVDEVPGDLGIGPAGGDPWAAVSSETLQTIAETIAREIAGKLSGLGYATRISTLLMPPARVFVAAGPGAKYDIDLETLNGPDAVVAAATPQDGDGTAAPTETANSVPAPLPEAPIAGKGKAVIRAVAVVTVRGSPGGGDELTVAMRRTLSAAGWPVVTSPRADALTIAGTVEVSAPKDGRQQVALRWTVETPKGKLLGDVKQANAIPAGALDNGWGDAATVVAQAASSGIFDIINRYR